MPDHEDSLGGETFSGEERQDPAEQSLGDGATLGGGVGEVVEVESKLSFVAFT